MESCQGTLTSGHHRVFELCNLVHVAQSLRRSAPCSVPFLRQQGWQTPVTVAVQRWIVHTAPLMYRLTDASAGKAPTAMRMRRTATNEGKARREAHTIVPVLMTQTTTAGTAATSRAATRRHGMCWGWVVSGWTHLPSRWRLLCHQHRRPPSTRLPSARDRPGAWHTHHASWAPGGKPGPMVMQARVAACPWRCQPLPAGAGRLEAARPPP